MDEKQARQKFQELGKRYDQNRKALETHWNEHRRFIEENGKEADVIREEYNQLLREHREETLKAQEAEAK